MDGNTQRIRVKSENSDIRSPAILGHMPKSDRNQGSQFTSWVSSCCNGLFLKHLCDLQALLAIKVLTMGKWKEFQETTFSLTVVLGRHLGPDHPVVLCPAASLLPWLPPCQLPCPITLLLGDSECRHCAVAANCKLTKSRIMRILTLHAQHGV